MTLTNCLCPITVTFSPPIFHFPPSNTRPQAPSPHQTPCTYTRPSHSLSYLIFIIHLFLLFTHFMTRPRHSFIQKDKRRHSTKQGLTAYSSSIPSPSHPRRRSPPRHYPTDSQDPQREPDGEDGPPPTEEIVTAPPLVPATT
jgi:hypothetical protein